MFFPTVYEHSLHPDPPGGDAVKAAYCKCALLPLCLPQHMSHRIAGWPCLEHWENLPAVRVEQ